jgi:hypothetical protein
MPIAKLREAVESKVRTPGYEQGLFDDEGNLMDILRIPPDVSDPALTKGYQERIRDYQQAEGRRAAAVEAGAEDSPINVGDLFRQRKAESEMITRRNQRAFRPTKKTSEMTPEVQARKMGRKAISEEMHSAVGRRLGDAAEQEARAVDAIHHGWRTVEEGATTPASDFVARWVIARGIPGTAGTALGAAASSVAFWRSMKSASKRKLANLIEAGDDTGAHQLLRTLADAYIQPERDENARNNPNKAGQ